MKLNIFSSKTWTMASCLVALVSLYHETSMTMTTSFNYQHQLLLLPTTFAFTSPTTTRRTTQRRTTTPWTIIPSSSFATTTTTTSTTRLYESSSSTTENDAKEQAKKLLERTTKLRQEIATLTGKTLEQVENEAKQERQKAKEAKRKEKAKKTSKSTISNPGRVYIDVPTTSIEMLQQARNAIERAYHDGNITRQTIRLALLREDETISDINEWPGGAQQMYRESAKPLTMSLLKDIRTTKNKNDVSFQLPPNVTDQDIWDFDGSGLITAKASNGPKDDVQAMVFPNTDVKYLKDIQTIDDAMGPNRLFLLINPFWRNLDSWGFNLLAPNAKNMAKEIIFNENGNDYEETYVLLRFSVRGESCIAIKSYPYDWQIFATLEEDDGYVRHIRLGSSNEEPKNDLVTKLLNEREEFKLTKTMRQFKKIL